MNLSDKLRILGDTIKYHRTKESISIETLAQFAFTLPEKVRRIEDGTRLLLSDESLSHMESVLGLRKGKLLDLADQHRSYLIEFVDEYKPQIIAMIDILRVYQSDDVDRILNDTTITWKEKINRKGNKMGSTKTAKPAAKPASKRVTKAPAKRASAAKKTVTAAPRRTR